MDFSSVKTLDDLKAMLQDFADDYSAHQHDGTSTRQFDTIRANGASLKALSVRKVGYGDTTPGLWTGVVNNVPQFYLGNATSYIKFDGVNFSILGALSVTQLDIPDTTTANSFHTDSSGNSWWGANVASGYAGANAYILNIGAAVFKNITVGGNAIQYIITNSGIFSFGDGSDGDVTISVDTTLTSDKYYNNLTVNSGKVLNPNGYRIFVKNTLTNNGTISRNGNAGGNGSNGTLSGPGSGGNGGSALADGYLKGSLGGGGGAIGSAENNGNAGDPHAGGNGATTTNSINVVAGSNAGNGGTGSGSNTGGTGGSGGALPTASNVKLIANWHLATLLDIGVTGSTVKFDNCSSAGGGGSGGGGSSVVGSPGGGGGGGGGSAGGIVAIYAKNIIIGASGVISADGGNGGNGGNGSSGADIWNACGGGGGGGGNGGAIIIVYNTLTNDGAMTVTAGTKGTKGLSGGGGGAKVDRSVE